MERGCCSLTDPFPIVVVATGIEYNSCKVLISSIALAEITPPPA